MAKVAPERGTVEYDPAAIAAFADLLASRVHDASAFHDELDLPYPKEDILTAIENQILRETSDERTEWLRTGCIYLVQYQKGVGFKPAYLLGCKLEDLPADPREKMTKVASLTEEQKRAKVLVTRSERELSLIQSRINAILILKKAREFHLKEFGGDE